MKFRNFCRIIQQTQSVAPIGPVCLQLLSELSVYVYIVKYAT
jgi:hypothetical protein